MGWLTGPRENAEKANLLSGRPGIISLPSGIVQNSAGMVYQDGSYPNYTRNGYGRNELVYACIRYRAESLPLSVIRTYPVNDETALENHPLRKLFAKPNPITNEFEFFEMSSTYKDLAGTCFWLVVKGRNGLPVELWPLRPDLVSVLPNPQNLADFDWIYRPDPERPDVAVPVPDHGSPRAKQAQATIIRIRYPNPHSDDPGWRYFGQPPLRPAARATTLDNGATDFADSLLRNHAMPSIVIESEKEIGEVLHQRLQSRWKEAFGGARRGTPAFMEKGMKIHEIGMNMQELQFPEMHGMTETRICMTFGIEPILVGAKEGLEHNAYKDYREARLAFWEEAMFSDQRRYIEPVRHGLLPLYQSVGRPTARVEWDNSGVPALKEAAGALWERATQAFMAGGLTRNDFRGIVGLPKVPGADVFLTPSGATVSEVGEDPAAITQSASASIGLAAAEHGIELTSDELAALSARLSWEG